MGLDTRPFATFDVVPTKTESDIEYSSVTPVVAAIPYIAFPDFRFTDTYTLSTLTLVVRIGTAVARFDDDDDIKLLPKGQKICSVLKKVHLVKE